MFNEPVGIALSAKFRIEGAALVPELAGSFGAEGLDNTGGFADGANACGGTAFGAGLNACGGAAGGGINVTEGLTGRGGNYRSRLYGGSNSSTPTLWTYDAVRD